MRHWAHLVRAGGLAWALAGNLAVPPASFAAPAGPPAIAAEQREWVEVGGDGILALSATAPPAPQIYGSFDHFGFAISPAQQFNTPFNSIGIEYQANIPPGSAVRFDLRASADGARWTAWEVDLASGASVRFDRPARFAQYRATLLGNRGARPSIGGVRLTPGAATATYTTLQDQTPVAPTFQVRATRQGMIGGRTANGHRITKRDHFVSLPSWRALASNGGREYLVRITYKGRSSVAPVYDVGPWNIHDNYWDEHREKFGDLKRGWPEDHAAYFDKYNGGRAEKGRVSFPTAIDVGDGVWWDDLGIKGDRAVVDVTFLWLGSDPLAAQPAPAEPAPAPGPAPAPPAEPAPPPPPAPAAPAPPPPAPEPAPPPAPEPAPPPAPAPAPPEPPAPPQAPEPAPPPAPPAPAPPPAQIVVDERDGAFKGQAVVKWYDGPKGCGNAGHALWTYSTPNREEGENTARWQPALPAEALYEVYAFVPACASKKPNTTSARYLIQHRDGAQEVVVDQKAVAGTWVLLGRFPFRPDGSSFVELRDVAGDSMRTIWFDAIKWMQAP